MKLFFAGALCVALLLSGSIASAQDKPSKTPCERNTYNCPNTPNPLPAAKTVWLDEMTWMDERDALAAGRKTIIIPSGGIEANGPWTALGKHDFVVRAECEAIARKLKDALCAPVLSLVPREGPPGSDRKAVLGDLNVPQETYERLVADLARGLKEQGFENVVFISDHGGSNQDGLKKIAAELGREWGGHAYYIPEYYKSWEAADALLLQKGITKAGVRDGVHDDPSVTLTLMEVDPELVRWSERVKAEKATIDSVSITDKAKVQKLGRELIDARADITVNAIRKAMGSSPTG